MDDIKDTNFSSIKNKFKNEKVVPLAAFKKIEIENVSAVQQRKIDWMWKDIIAYGKMTLFAGEPGVGKSQLLLYIASIVSNGGRFHQENKLCAKNRVLLISGEDNADDTIKPRLMALGADLLAIDYVKGIKQTDKNGNDYYDTICIIEDLVDIEKKIIENSYKLIIIDPISMYLGSVDENKNKEIRSALGRLTALAERHNLSIILNSHFSKPSSGGAKNAVYRVMGSIGFAAAARIVFGVMKDPEDAERRLFLPIKNNIGQDKDGFVYKIKPVLVDGSIETSKVEWFNEKVTLTANEVLNNGAESKASPRLEDAKDLLIEMLKFGGAYLCDILKEAKKRKISVDRIYLAKDVLKIYEDPGCFGKKKKRWMLSPDSP
jgi:energy-coupling factor transporter ATP-binding protein EcfA2